MNEIDYANVNYSKLTINDKNLIKRRLQKQRLLHSIGVLKREHSEFPGNILDYGAGNGELCKNLSYIYPKSYIICYEPSAKMRSQAIENVKEFQNIKVVEDLKNYRNINFDYIFCLEVMEHLPKIHLHNTLIEIKNLSQKTTKIIFSVPNEIFIVALLKGIFRIGRRYGEVDAKIRNIIQAFCGFPPKKRTTILFDGLPYIIRHIGFNHRSFKKILQDYFHLEGMYGSPLKKFPIFMNFEIYYLCKNDM